MSNRPLPRRRCALRLVSAYQLYPSGGYTWDWAILDRGLVAPAGDSNSPELLQTVASSTGKSHHKTASELIKQTLGLAKYLAAFAPLEARTRKLSAMLVGQALAEPGLFYAKGASCWLELSWNVSPTAERPARGNFSLATIGGETIAYFTLGTRPDGRLKATEFYASHPAELSKLPAHIGRLRQLALPPMREFLSEIF